MRTFVLNDKSTSTKTEFQTAAGLVSYLKLSTAFKAAMEKEFDAYLAVMYDDFIICGIVYSARDTLITWGDYEDALKEYVELELLSLTKTIEEMEDKQTILYQKVFEIKCLEN